MKRFLSKNVKKELLNNPLWTGKIKKDCETQKVFFTLRDNRVDLYHKGGKLFGFEGKDLKTHIKYAAVIDTEDDSERNYLSESALKALKITPDYYENYKRIKENCSKYSGVEAAGVSNLYHKFSYLSDSDIVILDIEISFDSLNGGGNEKDRIDFLLFDKKTKTLQFVEAKHFINSELWSTGQPSVIKQIDRYESQVKKKKDSIISEYSNYVQTINEVFDLSLPEPEKLDNKVTLFVFGFDDDQKKGRLNRSIVKDSRFSGIKSYQKGNFNNFNMGALWKGKIL